MFIEFHSNSILVSYLLGFNNEQCNNKSVPPKLFSGVGLTDKDIFVRFFKPISDGYYFKLSYWIDKTSGYVEVLRLPTAFGPAFAKLASNLKPNSTYDLTLGLYCANTNDTMSKRIKIDVKTLPKCKTFSMLGGKLY